MLATLRLALGGPPFEPARWSSYTCMAFRHYCNEALLGKPQKEWSEPPEHQWPPKE